MNYGRSLLLFIFTLIIVMLGEALSLSYPNFGNFGKNPEEAKKTEFFRWFHLEQTGIASQDGGRVISFKPSGPNFHQLVTVKVTTAAGEVLRGMELILNRSFIDDPREGLFARDIAKSFLLAGLAAPRDREITDLINEIQYRGASTRPVLRHESLKRPPLPEKPTPGYLAYLGQEPHYEHLIPGFLLRLENKKLGEVSVLVISIKRP
jgi:hypothetical protein